MRRALITLALAILALGACSSGNQPDGDTDTGTAPAATPITRTPATLDPRAAGRTDYLNGLYLVDPTGDLEAIPDNRKYDLGVLTCDLFDAGLNLTQVFDRLDNEPEFDITDGGTSIGMPALVAEAAIYLCPEHQQQVAQAATR